MSFYLCLVAAKRLYCEWSRSVSTSQCPRGMPRACSVGLVENGQRAPSECKGALQDCQVSLTLTLIPPTPQNHTTSAVIVRTKSPLNWVAFYLLQIFLMFCVKRTKSLVSSSSSYKSCLPKSHRIDIQRRNRLDRFRIRNTLKHFLKKLGSCSVDEYSLKLKYLIELSGIEPTLGSETYHVNCSSDPLKSAFSLVRVTGENGIQTSKGCHTDDALVRKIWRGVIVI